MIISVKLDNPNFCDLCPCLEGGIYCRYFNMKDLELELGECKTVRPEKCKIKNGI